jgi:DnaJ family protein C protein 28
MDSDDPEEEKRSTGSEKPTRRRVPPLPRWDSVMDELIEDAIRSGAFDDLPGKGKPLNLSNNPHSRESQLAYQLLKDNNYTLPWIAKRKEVQGSIDELREEMARVARRYEREYRAALDETIRMGLRGGWRRQLAAWQERIAAVNRQIDAVNLKQPLQELEIYKLTLDIELSKAGGRRELE